MKKRPPGRLGYDVAYGCFLLWALTVLLLGVTRASYTGAEWAGGGGGILLVLLPLILASFIAMLAGIVLSLRLWKHWPLLALSGGSVLELLVTEYFPQVGSAAFTRAVPIAYGVGAAAMSVWWFLRLRWLPVPPPVSAGKE